MSSCKLKYDDKYLQLETGDFKQLKIAKNQLDYYFITENLINRQKEYEKQFDRGFFDASKERKNKLLKSSVYVKGEIIYKCPKKYVLPYEDAAFPYENGYNLYYFLYSKKAILLNQLYNKNFDLNKMTNDIYCFFFPETAGLSIVINEINNDNNIKDKQKIIEVSKAWLDRKEKIDIKRGKDNFKKMITEDLNKITQ